MSGDISRAISPEETRWLVVASSLVGIAGGVLLVTVLRRLRILPPFMPMPSSTGWYIGGYELLVALVGATGVFVFCPLGGRTKALAGAGAALAAMLLADLCRSMSYLPVWEWADAPAGVWSMFRWGGWTKILRYTFGVYVAGYLCSGEHAAAQTTEGEP